MADNTTRVDETDADIREAWIQQQLAALTRDEKASLTAGRDAWRTPTVDRLGIPSIKVTDGPNGARGDAAGRETAVCFPVGTALGASWNVDLLREVGGVLAAEAQSKGAQILLGPTVNLHRSPLAGRNFECYAEDPYLTARLAVGYVSGLQGGGVGACIKHYVANDSEHERMTISSEVDERTLRELYLVPFEAAVADAGTWSIMAAYNRINGVYACDHRELLVDRLKTEWGFDGLVISDWGAVHDTVAAAQGGCDLEMPGPARHFGPALADAVHAGLVDTEMLDDKVRRLLRTVWRSGRLDHPDERDEQSIDLPEHRALARRAATEGMVLLRNVPVPDSSQPVLPLVVEALDTIAVIGPNAAVGVYQGGGSSIVRAHYVVHPLEAIIERVGDAAVIRHEPGGAIDRYQPPPEPSWFTTLDDDGRGVRLEIFDNRELAGPPISSRLLRGVSWAWWSPPAGLHDPTTFSARWTAAFTPPVAGEWQLGLSAIGTSRVLVDGEVVVDNWTAPELGELFFSRGSIEVVETVTLEAGRSYALEVEYATAVGARPGAIRFGMTAPLGEDPVERAEQAARQADVAVVIVGTNGDWETEGSDRPTMRLPGRQDELIGRVAATNPRTVVVVNTGSPVEMRWADDVGAILQVWFPGQEYGDALADVLFGDADPGGRLPTTFPYRYEDHPARFGYPGENGQVRYGEGVFIGYRGYDERALAPRFPFGHGLSYTQFSLGAARVTGAVPGADADGDAAPGGGAWRGPVVAQLEVDVTNIGDRAGSEVVQLFVRPSRSRLSRPVRELVGFVKVTLEPGAAATVSLDLDARSFASYDTSVPGWVAEAGRYDLLVSTAGVAREIVPFVLPDTMVLATA